MTVPTGQIYTILSVRSSNEKNTGIVEVKCESGTKSLFYSASVLQANQVYTQHACSAGTVDLIVTGGGGGDQHNIYITYVDNTITSPQLTITSANPTTDYPLQFFIIFVVFSVSMAFIMILMRKLL